MPLVHDTVYAIRNDLTHTVIDFTGDPNRSFAFGTLTLSPMGCTTMLTRASLVTGWGWHGGSNQKVRDKILSVAHMLMRSVYTVETHPSWEQMEAPESARKLGSLPLSSAGRWTDQWELSPCRRHSRMRV